MSKITLIIGAGANKEINHEIDLGADLIKNIGDRVTDRTSHKVKNLSLFLNRIGLSSEIRDEFVKKLDVYISEVPTCSIDAFLDEVETFPEYKDLKEDFLRIGRISIIFHVMGYEGQNTINNIKKDLSDKKTWMSTLCTFLDEKVFIPNPAYDLSIVTFNYDRILEYYLLEWFKNKKLEVAKNFIDMKLHHVYGRIGYLAGLKPLTPEEPLIEFNLGNNNIQIIDEIKNNIKLVFNLRNETAEIKETITQSEKILIMGYGFDSTNNRRLGLHKLEDINPKFKVAVYPSEKLDFKNRRNLTETIRGVFMDAEIHYCGCLNFIRNNLK